MNSAADFEKFLVAKCEDDESTEFVDALQEQAETQITGGKGSLGFMQSAAVNGKTFTKLPLLTADQVALACINARRLYNDDAGSAPFTFIDFSCLRP